MNPDNIFIKILYVIGTGFLYLLGVVLVLSSGCFIFFGMNRGTDGYIPPAYIMIPIGLVLGLLALGLIRFLVRLGKKGRNR